MSIKSFAICVTTILCVGYVAGEYCYNDVVGACSPVGLFRFFSFYKQQYLFFIFNVVCLLQEEKFKIVIQDMELSRVMNY